MIFRHEYAHGVWVDLEQPTPEEIHDATREFALSDRVEAELLSPTPSPLVAGDPEAALLVLHFPAMETAEGDLKNQEVDLVVGKHFILTVRYEVVAPLYHLQKLLEAEELTEGRSALTTDMLLEILFAHLYASVRDSTNHSASRLARIEHDMFAGRERETVRTISNASREFLHLEAALANQEEPLARFLKTLSDRGFFGRSFYERAARINAERAQVAHHIRTHRAVATELRETNSVLLNATQNSIMKTFTVVNVIFLPLGLITWIFAMRTEGTPFIMSPHAFWIVLGFMAVVGLTLTFVFAKKRWLF
ncbi:MAG TPA: magnesium transporter CorA family protein [Candidatus Paceibacterota bacterium]|nr:magnesium transporter CorA family protein [Candidatus Paceibacterota bacterium]